MIDDVNGPFAERRGFTRHPVPKGTTAHFKSESGTLEAVYIRDISEGGMLICDYFPGKRYRLNSIINHIFVHISDKIENGEIKNHDKTCVFIDKGRVVRHCFDQFPYITCYGISFLHKGPSLKDQLHFLNNRYDADSLAGRGHKLSGF